MIPAVNESLWIANDSFVVIDQRYLPFEMRTFRIETLEEACFAIRNMVVRGAPLIGVTAACGMYLAVKNCRSDDFLNRLTKAKKQLDDTRPTAVNLMYATQRMLDFFYQQKPTPEILLDEVVRIREEEIASCQLIGQHGLALIREARIKNPNRTVQILTHCNAGWLATVKWGTALAPIYLAHQEGIPLHVWVDETRPRNQGARLTAWELNNAGIPHTVIADNAGGHLMQNGQVDMVIVGSDRTTANGDVANKIGTYLKALAAADNKIPFYVALPTSTFDMTLHKGVSRIAIEERDASELETIEGWDGEKITTVRILPSGTRAANYGFDVTPARLITLLITEKGNCSATESSIRSLLESS